jgi:hypothetical protein
MFFFLIYDKLILYLDIVSTVYHLLVYVQSIWIHSILLWLSLFTIFYLLYSVSNLIDPSSGASFKLYERIGKW